MSGWPQWQPESQDGHQTRTVAGLTPATVLRKLANTTCSAVLRQADSRCYGRDATDPVGCTSRDLALSEPRTVVASLGANESASGHSHTPSPHTHPLGQH